MWSCSFFNTLGHEKSWAHAIVSMLVGERKVTCVTGAKKVINFFTKRSKSKKSPYVDLQLLVRTRTTIKMLIAQLKPSLVSHCAR